MSSAWLVLRMNHNITQIESSWLQLLSSLLVLPAWLMLLVGEIVVLVELIGL